MKLRRSREPAAERLADLRDRLGALDRRAARLCSELSPAELAWRPADGWSVLQVFEHLRLVNERYLASTRKAVREGRAVAARTPEPADGAEASPSWKPSLLGGLISRFSGPGAGSGPRLRLRAPGPFRPSADPSPEAPEAYRRQLAELARLLLESRHLDLAATRVEYPLWSRLSLNLGDAFEILIGHAERHMLQVGRILSRPERPRAVEGPGK